MATDCCNCSLKKGWERGAARVQWRAGPGHINFVFLKSETEGLLLKGLLKVGI